MTAAKARQFRVSEGEVNAARSLLRNIMDAPNSRSVADNDERYKEVARAGITILHSLALDVKRLADAAEALAEAAPAR